MLAHAIIGNDAWDFRLAKKSMPKQLKYITRK